MDQIHKFLRKSVDKPFWLKAVVYQMRLALCLVVSALSRAQDAKVAVSVDAGGAVRQASAAAN